MKSRAFFGKNKQFIMVGNILKYFNMVREYF